MYFQSLDYALFLILALVVYWSLLRLHALRLVFLALASCAFYMSLSAKYIPLLFVPTIVDFWVAKKLATTDDVPRRKALLAFSVVTNLGLLFAFKYFDWFSESAATALAWAGYPVQPWILGVALPVGLSFYTFEALSYTIDVYRRHLPAEPSFIRFVCFITFFPKLVAGPIVRGSELLPQLDVPPTLTKEKVSRGLFLILGGLVKKVAVADFLARNLVDRVFVNPEGYTSVEVVVALYAFTMQIYCDFSGYTDIARGSALFFGFELPENFNRPYAATSPADFWRRWHMTLSTWLRDYLYYPIGGSRVPAARAYFNLWITFFLIGLWHRASWNFVIYGAIHGSIMALHRYFVHRFGRPQEDPPWYLHATKIVLALQLTVFSRILFRSTDLQNARDVTAQIVGGGTSTAQISLALWLLLIGSFAFHYHPKKWDEIAFRYFHRATPFGQAAVAAVVVGLLMLVASSQAVPYIYFQH